MSGESLRADLTAPSAGYTLYLSNLPYHVHASAIQDMLDEDNLPFVRVPFSRMGNVSNAGTGNGILQIHVRMAGFAAQSICGCNRSLHMHARQ